MSSVRLVRLRADNFGSLKDIDISLSSSGLTLVRGENKDNTQADSNGSGKSMVLDAIAWCLWGKTIRGLTHDDVVSAKYPKDCIVTVNFSSAAGDFEVTRVRQNKSVLPGAKLNDVILRKGGQEVKLPSLAETNDLITQAFGMPFQVFQALMPGAGLKLAEATDKQAKELLESLLQTEVFAKARAEASTRLKEVMKSKSELESSEKVLQGKYLALQDSFLKNTAQAEQFEEQKAAMLRKVASDIRATEESLRNLIPSQGTRTREEILKDKAYLEKQRRDLEASDRKAFEELNRKKSTLSGQLAALDKYRDSQLAGLKRSKISPGVCTACMQDIGEEHVHSVSEYIDEKIAEIETKYLSDANGIRAQIGLLGKFSPNADIAVVEEKLRELVAEENQQIAAAKAQAAEKQLMDQLSRLQDQYAGIESRENVHELNALDNKRALEQVAEEKLSLVEGIKVLTEKQANLDFWVDSFSPKGLRNFVLDRVIPILNSSAKKYAEMLSSDLRVHFSTREKLKSDELRDSFSIQVSYVNGATSYQGCSAGERARANLVICLAIGDLAAMRSSQSLSFRFLDEPFEAVDESGIDAIVTLLRSMNEKYESIFLISHLDYLQQQVNNIVTVVKEHGESRIVC